MLLEIDHFTGWAVVNRPDSARLPFQFNLTGGNILTHAYNQILAH